MYAASNSEIQNVWKPKVSSDIGLVSPEWLQSDDSFSFDTLSDIDELMVDLSDFAATLPRPSHFYSAIPTSVDQFGHITKVGRNTRELQEHYWS